MNIEEMQEAVFEGMVECECGNMIELDGTCHCGRESPFISMGMI